MNEQKHYQYRLAGYFQGKGIYLPLPGYPGRSISIEEDHGGLRALTEDEIFAWKATQFDLALTQRLEKERERAEEAADAWFADEAELDKEATLRNGSGVF